MIYQKKIYSIILHVERPNPFPLRLGTMKRCPFSLLLFNIVQHVLAPKKKRRHTDWEVEIELLFGDVMIVHIEIAMESITKLLEQMSSIRYESNIKVNCIFYILTNLAKTKNFKNAIPFTIAPKNTRFINVPIHV